MLSKAGPGMPKPEWKDLNRLRLGRVREDRIL